MLTIYTTKNCSKCRLTERLLTAGGVEHETTLATDDDITRFHEVGVRSFPVVLIDGKIAWSDFDPDKIKEVINDGKS